MEQKHVIIVIHARKQFRQSSKLLVFFGAHHPTWNEFYRYVWLLHVVVIREKPVHRYVQRVGSPFQRFYGRSSVFVFHSRNITPEEPGPFFDVALGHILPRSQCLQLFADDHSNPPARITRRASGSGKVLYVGRSTQF